jgi:two-component system, NarL family, invasion response regulator UvrY
MLTTETKNIKVLLADEHPIACQGIQCVFEHTPDITIEEEVTNVPDLLKKVGETKFNMVLFDISMSGFGGLDVLKTIRSERPDLPVLIFSSLPEDQYALRCLKAGAAGFLPKTCSKKQLIETIRKVAEGRKYVSPALVEKLACDLDFDSEKPLHQSLSDREYQVFCMIASGKTVSEIATELSLSVPTISTYRGRILEKMKLSNNSQLAYYAIKSGLIN